MLSTPNEDTAVFEVAVYNREVRALVKENRSHNLFGDNWADLHVQGIAARNEAEARALVLQRYRPEEGFVIAEVTRRPG
ncbi:MAG: hypothetical protein H7841_01470 [Magnetospirillum sp. WYHS-4]